MKNAWRNIEKNRNEVVSLVTPGKKIIIFDTETTGFGRNAKIIQFSACTYIVTKDYGLEKLHMIDHYINPEEPLSEKITELTGISDELLSTHKNESYYAPLIFKYMQMADLWVAYNCGFDLRMMDQMAERQNMQYEKRPILDVLLMARDIIPKTMLASHKLGEVTRFLYPDADIKFHSSDEDIIATTMCFQCFLHFYLHYVPKNISRKKVVLRKVSFFINPKQPSMKRIKIYTDEIPGLIFWDVVNKCWSCKATNEAIQWFESVDLKDLEEQILKRYEKIIVTGTMDELAEKLEKQKKEKGIK